MGKTNPITTKPRYACRQLPSFNPTYYQSWAIDVEQAFAEREWTRYLSPPTDSAPHDPMVTIQSTAFLNQSISYEHISAIRQCKTAHEIWLTPQQRYASRSREEEVRLESQILELRKTAKRHTGRTHHKVR